VVDLRRASLPLMFWVVVPPWILATAATMVWGLSEGLSGLGLLFGTRMVLVPVLLAAGALGVVAGFKRWDGLRRDFWPGAGLAFALLALFINMAVSATWGEWGAIMWIWSFYSGYVFFVFFFGGIAWKRTFH
jgi:hypothetical protein